jgi:hypothetical protein
MQMYHFVIIEKTEQNLQNSGIGWENVRNNMDAKIIGNLRRKMRG